MSTELTATTTYSMSFDFRSASQQAILKYLQDENYKLLAYKGAKGPSQISAGLPTWFSVPFDDIFGETVIEYAPQYCVYVFNRATIAANTVIKIDSRSDEIPLGTALELTPTGGFTSAGKAPAGSIKLINSRPAGTPNITVGLAGLVNLPTGSNYLPFCAFTLTPQGSIQMTPTEEVALMAAQVDLLSGNVQATASAPGCSFTFNDTKVAYDLMVEDSTYTITNRPGSIPVKYLPSNEALSFLNQ